MPARPPARRCGEAKKRRRQYHDGSSSADPQALHDHQAYGTKAMNAASSRLRAPARARRGSDARPSRRDHRPRRSFGLCHTDIDAAHATGPVKPTPPFTPGHEGVGSSSRSVRRDRGRPRRSCRVTWLGTRAGPTTICVSGWKPFCLEQNTATSLDGSCADDVKDYGGTWSRCRTASIESTLHRSRAPEYGLQGDQVAARGRRSRRGLRRRRSRRPRHRVRGDRGGRVIAVDLVDEARACRSSVPSPRSTPEQDPAEFIKGLRWSRPGDGPGSQTLPRRTGVPARCAAKGSASSSSPLPDEDRIELPIFETVQRDHRGGLDQVGTRSSSRVFELHAAGRRVSSGETVLADVNEATPTSRRAGCRGHLHVKASSK